MSNLFTIESPMPPLWLMHPHIPRFSIGWRMGYGEGYKFKWGDWFDTLREDEKMLYATLFPEPLNWGSYYQDEEEEEIEEEELDEEESLLAHGIHAWWHKRGEMQYSREKMLQQPLPDQSDYVFFWKPREGAVDKDCLGQWQPSVFNANGDEYTCTEQYMMAEKADLFEDEEIKEQIMKTSDPKTMKALGKKVRNFDQVVWDKAKYTIVLDGNYYKFSQNKVLRDYLLSTGDKILVEASPLDTIWGIGLSDSNEKVYNPATWRGKNLLGFALMEVRDEMRRVYKNYDRIDWAKLKEYDVLK